MKTFTKILIIVPLSIFCFYLLSVNYRLYYTPSFENQVNQSVLQQLHFLKNKLRAGEAEKMQKIYPEGFVFLTALYGLTWTDLLANVKSGSPTFKEGMQEIDWTIAQLSTKSAKAQFGGHLPLPYGAFYNGWFNYLLGKKLILQRENERNSLEIKQFKENCKNIVQAYQSEKALYLESYLNGIWPADNMLCIAALKLHDQIFDPEYTDFVKNWLEKVKTKVDPKTGLIPHTVSKMDGTMSVGARGSSQSLMLNFLPAIDSIFAQAQFNQYKKLFLTYRFGLPGIREYMAGDSGIDDIDSGPVLLGVGGAASIVGIRAFAQNRDWETSQQIRNCVEGFGFPLQSGKQKYYLLGNLAMADVFIAWANVSYQSQDKSYSSFWRLQFQFISLIPLLGMFFLIYFFKSKKRK